MLKKRHILVNEKHVTTAIDIVNTVIGDHILVAAALMNYCNFSVGCCGWAKAPECWFIDFVATDKDWYTMCYHFKQKGVEILPETVGY